MPAVRKRVAVATAADATVLVEPASPSDIIEAVNDPKRFPSPLRPVGSGSSTTRSIAAAGGTQMNLAGMNRVLSVTADTVTVQPGIALADLAETLAEEGLELLGGFDLANRSVGGTVCAAGLEASMAGDVSQFAAHLVSLKAVSPEGKKFSVGASNKNLLTVMRLSYGLLGIVYEATLRVRPVQAFEVETKKVAFGDFAKLAPRFAALGAGIKTYMLPFRDRVYIELRRGAAAAGKGKKFAWRIKDWACYRALPDAVHSLGRAVPIRQLRYPLIDSLSEATQSLMNNALLRSGSNAVEQSGRFLGLNNKHRFQYCTWAFPVSELAGVAIDYRDFCRDYYERTGFRCDMPSVGFRLNRDRSAVLSPAFERPMFTISPLSTQTEGWDDFLLDLAEFAEARHGVPFFNQTRHASAAATAERFGQRLTFFRNVRRRLDPHDRMLNQFFAPYMK
jgi:FAD binding domain/D-arabinono-1,4-lactone oxidase